MGRRVISKRLVSAIVVLVSIIFTLNYGLQFVIDGHESDPAITALFGAIVGTVLALSKRDPNSGPKGRGEQSNSGGEGS